MRVGFLAALLAVGFSPLLETQTYRPGEEPIEQRLRYAGLEVAETHRFFDTLVAAFTTDDRRSVAALVHYPFRTKIRGKWVVLKTPKAFLARYQDVVTPPISQAVKSATFAGLFANWKGVMIGNGEVWFGGFCAPGPECRHVLEIKIIAINN